MAESVDPKTKSNNAIGQFGIELSKIAYISG